MERVLRHADVVVTLDRHLAPVDAMSLRMAVPPRSFSSHTRRYDVQAHAPRWFERGLALLKEEGGGEVLLIQCKRHYLIGSFVVWCLRGADAELKPRGVSLAQRTVHSFFEKLHVPCVLGSSVQTAERRLCMPARQSEFPVKFAYHLKPEETICDFLALVDLPFARFAFRDRLYWTGADAWSALCHRRAEVDLELYQHQLRLMLQDEQRGGYEDVMRNMHKRFKRYARAGFHFSLKRRKTE